MYGARLLSVVKEELAAYDGRGALVARMVISATIVMLVTMIYRLPFGFHGAVYTFLVSRQGPRSTLQAASTIVIAVSASLAFALVGSILSLGDPMLRLVWVVTALFAIFFALSTITDYVAATGFGLIVVVTLSLWDQVILPETKVENTLWAFGQTTIACLVTLGVELAFFAWKPWNELTAAIVERLSAVADFLTRVADGLPAHDAKQRLTRLAMVGTSRLGQSLQRSPHSSQIERMGIVVVLAGHLVDIATNMAHIGMVPSSADRARMRAVAESIASMRDDLLREHGLQRAEHVAVSTASDAVPLLTELEETGALMAEAFATPEANEAYALRPRSDWRWFRPDAFSNPDHIKFALKGCFAAGLCYVLYTAVAWPGISTAVVTCLFTALTSIGASRQKQALRIGGAITGATIALAAQLFILPHVDSIGGFTVLFIGVTTGAAWIATSTPRFSYFGVQLAVAFYVVHLQEFAMQTSLAVARDRIVGILLGLCMMWIVFDQLWGSPAAVAMKREMISTLRRLALFVREPLTTDTRAAVDRIRGLRETINAGFDTVRALGDGVLFEFGPTREADLAWRRRFIAWQPLLRLAFLTRVALVKYRLGVPGFELPPALGAAHAEFDRELAKRFDSMADRLANAAPEQDALEPALARLEAASRIHGDPHAIVPLSRRIAHLTASLYGKLSVD
jgi:multidrug resistance protein MdtO